MTLDRREILTRLHEALRRKKSARGAYPWAVDDFLSTKPKALDVEAVLSYLDQKEKAGDKPATLKMRFYALKFLFKLYNTPWTLSEREVFSTRERRQKLPQPWFRKEEVISIITQAREKCTPEELAMLAIATVYGCRRSELADIRREDLDFEQKTITIYARKGGRVATQLMPVEIIPYIKDYDWPLTTEVAMSHLFKSILASTIGPRDGYGWHSLRRGIITELRNAGVSADDRYAFMRWSQGIILETYEQHEIGEVEGRIFPVHPYLLAWR